jgi:hypothetical protein
MTGILTRLIAVAACCLIAFGAVALPPAAGGKQAAWTFAIYMCSDNDLDYWGQMNIDWLKSVGSSNAVKFVVLWDPSTGPANLWLVEKGSVKQMTDFEYDGVETNMGDPDVLESLVAYLDSKVKSENLLIDLWDHGDDFRGICFDYDTGDGNGMDYLSHQEIGDALAGKPVSIIAADGCGLGVIEAAYEYFTRGVTAEWFVANENYVPLQGFPYDTIASDLVSDPGMTPEELSKVMVKRYAEFYTKGWLTELAAIRLSAVGAMVEELWDVTAILEVEMADYRGLVSSGRAQATMGWSQYGWEAYVDFPTIFEVIYAGAPAGSDLKVEAGELLAAIEDAVPYVSASQPADVWDPEGLSVYFPPADGSFKHNVFWRGSLYPTMQFAQDGWLDFLNAFYGL